MTDNDEIIINDKSGISVEEQKEILSAINGIAEKNRKRLSQKTITEEKGDKTQINAGKSGALFPLAVNIAAIVVLCAGVFFLVSFNGKVDSQLRTGNAVYNVTEKALIEDIRKDTEEKIAAKEREMSSITSRLEEVDAQLFLLYSTNQELTSEQLETEKRLLQLQVMYREELATLQDERTKILESSRSAEASLRAQLDERTREYSAAHQAVSADLDSALKELEKLSTDKEKTAALEAQLAGYLALYSSAGNSPQNNSGASDQTELAQINARLEQSIDEMQKTIEALSSGSSGQAARLLELEDTVSTLRALVSSLENGSAEKDRTISSLENERNSLTRTNQSQEQEIANLRNQIDVIRQALMDN